MQTLASLMTAILPLAGLLGTAATAGELEIQLYNEVRPVIKEEYESALAELPADVTAKPDAFDVVSRYKKMIYYNKAVAFASCVAEAMRQNPGELPDSIQDAAEPCFHEETLHMATILKLSDYASVLDPLSVMKCELKARKFAAEVEMPPYEFLAADSTKLYDSRVFFECVSSL